MPTSKQIRAAELTLENLRSDKPKTKGEVLIEAGYSEAMSTTPSQVTNTTGFIQALETAGVTDDKIARIMNEGLEAVRNGEPDYGIRHKYLDTAIKVKGHLVTEGGGGDTYNTWIQQNNINPNAPEAKKLVDSTLDMLMKQTEEQ